jgi:hypothetical protein
MMESDMVRRTRWACALLLCLGSSPVFGAQDDDDILDILLGDDEDEATPGAQRPDEADEGDEDEDPDEDPDESAAPTPAPESSAIPDPSNFLVPMDEEDEFYEDETPTSASTTRPGEDNAALYRGQLQQVTDLSPDEESLSWEQYLRTYPLSVFRDQVEARMEELSSYLYGDEGPDGPVDAGHRELGFAQGLLIEPIDPRSRLRGGFAWGFPNWINLVVDYEHQLQRKMSVHAGFQQRFAGPSLESGVRYAFIKSTRTDFILTAIGDIHLNLAPIAPGIRPMIAAGKRFRMGKESAVDVQGQLGPDLMFYPTQFSPRMLGGLNVTVSPSPTVKIFLESLTYMKDLAWEDGGNFRFNQLAFGIRFVGQRNGEDVYDGAAGASVPYSVNYWRYHYGAVMGDFNYFL